MNKKNGIVRFFVVAFLISSISGCDTVSKKNEEAINKLQGELQQSIELNNQLARRQQQNKLVTLPSAVDKALVSKTVTPKPTSNQQRFNIAVNNQDIRDFFTGLAQSSHTSFVVTPSAQANITLNMKNVTLTDIFSALMSAYKIQVEKTSYGYLVAPQQIESKTFIINYLASMRNSNSSITGQEGGGGLNHKSSDQKNFWSLVTSNIRSILGCSASSQNCKDKSIEVNPLTNTLIVSAYPADIEKVSRYVANLNDNLETQVIIEAKALSVKLDNEHQTGIDWNVLQNLNIPATVTYKNNITPPPGNTFTAATNSGSINAIIGLLSKQGTVVDISSPRITTLNNQPAMIKVGTTSYLATGSSNSTRPLTQGAATTEQVSSIQLQPFFSGVSLLVTPHVGDNGRITMHLHPVISKTIKKTLDASSGSDQTNVSLPTPETTLSESDNVVQASNGQVVVVGGMMIYTNQNDKKSLPGMENSPIQPLTGSAANTLKKEELVILLKAKVVKHRTWLKDLKKTAKSIVSEQ